MGFEEDFERGVRDGKWTKPLLDFKDNKPVTEIAARVEKALSHDVRRMFPVIKPLVERFDHAYQTMAEVRQPSLDLSVSENADMVAAFQLSCKEDLASVDRHPLAEQFVERAADRLEAGSADYELFRESRESAHTRLVTDWLASHIRGKLEPAVRLGIARNAETPPAAEARCLGVMNNIRLVPLAEKLIEGQNKRVKAPRRLRPTMESVMGDSVL